MVLHLITISPLPDRCPLFELSVVTVLGREHFEAAGRYGRRCPGRSRHLSGTLNAPVNKY
jgi:hypothetical protein